MKAFFNINKITTFMVLYAEIELNDNLFQIKSYPGGNIIEGTFIKNNIYFDIRKGLKIDGFLDFYIKKEVLFDPAEKVKYSNG